MNSLLLQIGKRLLVLSMDAALRRALPAIYRRLDLELPLLLTHKAPAARIQGNVARAISDALGKRATRAQVEAVAALYDPIQAAENRQLYPPRSVN